MISTCQCYNDFKGANNTWQNGHFRPMSFEYALYEASLEIFNESKKIWENNQIVDDNLRHFFKEAQLPIKDFATGGIIGYPTDYSMFSNLRFFSKTKTGKGVQCSSFDLLEKDGKDIICRPLTEDEKKELLDERQLYERSFTKVSNQRFDAVLDSEIIEPSLTNAYCTQNEKGFRAVPWNIGWIVLDYLSVPKRPKLVYKKDPLTRKFLCIPDQSTNLPWGPEMLPELMSRVKTKYASFVGDTQKYSEGTKETADIGS